MSSSYIHSGKNDTESPQPPPLVAPGARSAQVEAPTQECSEGKSCVPFAKKKSLKRNPPSMEDNVIDQGRERSLVDTPIRNSASNLIALGQHILTPRQGRMWNVRTSPR